MTGNHTMAGSPNEKTRFRPIDMNTNVISNVPNARRQPLKAN